MLQPQTARPRGRDGLVGLPEWFWFPKGEWAPVSNALIVGNYLTTLGHPAEQDLAMLARLQLP